MWCDKWTLEDLGIDYWARYVVVSVLVDLNETQSNVGLATTLLYEAPTKQKIPGPQTSSMSCWVLKILRCSNYRPTVLTGLTWDVPRFKKSSDMVVDR